MRRSSIELSELVEHISQAGQASCWLSALRILLAVEPDFLRADGPPHPLLQYIVTPRMEGDWGTGEWGIRFEELLRDQHFTGAQRQAILVAWALFNGGDQESERRVRFDDVCCRLDPDNFQAVVDAMEIRRGRLLAPEGVQPVFAEEVDQERRREEDIGRILETLRIQLDVTAREVVHRAPTSEAEVVCWRDRNPLAGGPSERSSKCHIDPGRSSPAGGAARGRGAGADGGR